MNPMESATTHSVAPRPEYGLIKPLVRLEDGGARTFGAGRLAVRSHVPLRVEDSTISATFTVTRGEDAGFSLRWAPPELRDAPSPTPVEEVAARIEDTAEGWRTWEAEHDIYEGPHRELVRLSSRVLKGLAYRPTGAIVAAPTTSLPETVGGERNWDYRFSWIRDSSLTIEALYIGTCSDEAEEFISFMTSSAGGRAGEGSLCSFWLVSCLAKAGETDRAARLFDRLSGYANDLGLLADEIDTANGEQLGNFPQAFSHIGLITAAWEIDKARAEGQ